MLTVVSDTHSTGGHQLSGRTLDAVCEADLVVHGGDFLAASALDAFEDEAARLRAVYGNNDDAEIRDRLPEVRTVEYGGVRFAVVHTRRGGDTALALLGRERGADAVIFGHSHRPTFDDSGPVALLNPGSHAQPRRHRAAHAELEPADDDRGATALRGRLVSPDGEPFERFWIAPRIDSDR